MSDNNKNIVVTIAFALLLVLFFLINLLKPDTDISLTEENLLNFQI